MKIISASTSNRASTLVTTLVLSMVMGLAVAAVLRLNAFRTMSEHGRAQWNDCYYQAENAMDWGAQKIADATVGGPSAPFLGNYSVRGGQLNLSYMAALVSGSNSYFKNAWVSISNHPSGLANLYRVTSSARVKDKVRTIQATIRKNPPSQLFDYEYFLNNWGWWWGSSITGNGDQRANWDFDFRGNPRVNGNILASGSVDSNGNPIDPLSGTPPFVGLAGNDPAAYVHAGVPRLQMPNLKDFTYYENKARAVGGQLSVGGTVVVSAVHTNGAKPGLYLAGTTAVPIVINGPVVIGGDVVIKGVITGIGTLYVGGNLYVAGDLTYKAGPDYATAPAGMSDAARDTWVLNALNDHKDLVAFAVRENVLGGDVNSAQWKSDAYDASVYGLKFVGGEANLGEDGIAGTPDDGILYKDTDGNGTPDSAWYDADGDAVVDANYNYDAQLKMTSTRIGKLHNYPVDGVGDPVSFSSLANNTMNRLDGVFYSNHAVAMRLAKNDTVMNGTVISRDEAIIFNRSLKLVYDPRIHSRYSDDPNRFIDLGLPVANKVRLELVEEITPREGF